MEGPIRIKKIKWVLKLESNFEKISKNLRISSNKGNICHSKVISAGHISSGFDKVSYPAHDLFEPFVFALLIRYFFSKQDWKL